MCQNKFKQVKCLTPMVCRTAVFVKDIPSRYPAFHSGFFFFTLLLSLFAFFLQVKTQSCLSKINFKLRGTIHFYIITQRYLFYRPASFSLNFGEWSIVNRFFPFIHAVPDALCMLILIHFKNIYIECAQVKKKKRKIISSGSTCYMTISASRFCVYYALSFIANSSTSFFFLSQYQYYIHIIYYVIN